MKNGADVTIKSNGGVTPLYEAVKNKHIDVEIFHMLLADIKDLNKTNKYGESFLHLAVRTNRKKIIRYLLNHGAHINVLTREGKHSVLYYVYYYNIFNDHELVDYLISKGAVLQKHEVKYVKRIKDREKNRKIKKVGCIFQSLGVSLGYLGLSYYLWEEKYKENQRDNPLIHVNAGLLYSASLMAVGATIGYAVTPAASGKGGFIRKLAGGIAGGVIGIVIGMVVTYVNRNKNHNNRYLYYAAPLVFSATLFTVSF